MPLSSYEQMELDNQNLRNDRIFNAQQQAHRRFMAGRRNFIESNPHAVSPFENRSILGRQRTLDDRAGLRDHELKMLQETGKNELAVAEQKRLGMIGQGADAARANADAALGASKNELEWRRHASDIQKEIEAGHDAAGLTAAEKKMLGELEIEKVRGASAVDAARAQSEARENAALAQAAMLKYKVDMTNAQKIAALQKTLEGKDKAQKVSIIRQALASNSLTADAAMKMLEEINSPTGDLKPSNTWKDK